MFRKFLKKVSDKMKPNRDKSVEVLANSIVNQICFDSLDGENLTNKEIGKVLHQVNSEIKEILIVRKKRLETDLEDTVNSINRIYVHNSTQQN